MEVVAEIEQRQEDDGRGGWNLSSSGRHAFRAYVPPSSHTDRSQLLTTRRPPRLLVDHPVSLPLPLPPSASLLHDFILLLSFSLAEI